MSLASGAGGAVVSSPVICWVLYSSPGTGHTVTCEGPGQGDRILLREQQMILIIADIILVLCFGSKVVAKISE